MRFDILTLFPDYVNIILSESIIGKAREKGCIEVCTHDIRAFCGNKHGRVDDTPYGGGMGMLMMAPPIYDCYEAVMRQIPQGASRRCIYLSPKGERLTQEKVRSLAQYDDLILLCGHYEGVDQRVLDEIADEEISVGDYVLTGGELPACILVDAVSRLCEGVLSDSVCYEEESIASGLLEYPQYTRPEEFMGRKIPDVLISGNHAKIEEWKREQSIKTTFLKRPDMLKSAKLSEKELEYVNRLKSEKNNREV